MSCTSDSPAVGYRSSHLLRLTGASVTGKPSEPRPSAKLRGSGGGGIDATTPFVWTDAAKKRRTQRPRVGKTSTNPPSPGRIPRPRAKSGPLLDLRPEQDSNLRPTP